MHLFPAQHSHCWLQGGDDEDMEDGAEEQAAQAGDQNPAGVPALPRCCSLAAAAVQLLTAVAKRCMAQCGAA